MKFIIDPITGKPSVTLYFFFISFCIATLINVTSSVFLILKGDYLTATYAPGAAVLAGFMFYRLRELDKIKIDLANRSIELTDEDNKNNA